MRLEKCRWDVRTVFRDGTQLFVWNSRKPGKSEKILEPGKTIKVL